MLCCKGTNNSCWVRVPASSDRSGLNEGQTKVCYCDDYCQSTGDCCPDLKDVKAECQGVITSSKFLRSVFIYFFYFLHSLLPWYEMLAGICER